MADLKAVAGGRGAGESRMSASAQDEALSALVDGEVQELELRRLLRDLEGDDVVAEQLSAKWYRYHLASSAMHGDRVIDAPDFAARVSAAIDSEPAHATSTGGWKRALGSFAVAASVTVAVVLGGQQLAGVNPDQASEIARVAPLPVGVVNTRGAVPVQASFGTGPMPTLQPADHTAYRELARQRLRRYSQEHAEHASLNTPQGMLPFARVPVIEE